MERDLAVCTQVDDFLMDGEEEDIIWLSNKLDARFECKATEWLTTETPIDFMGIDVKLTDDRILLSMSSYIDKMVASLAELGLKTSKRKVSVPISQPINEDSPKLVGKMIHLFLSGNGCVAWLSNTIRLDVAYAFSRIGQHSAAPSISALQTLAHTISYIEQHKHLCLSQRLYPEDLPMESAAEPNKPCAPQLGFRFYTDSDHAGNAEKQNKRRSQNGTVTMLYDAAVDWTSKVSSIAFATPLVGESHAEMSSGGNEIYAAGNATYGILDLCYLYEECGMKFPIPFVLQMDNATAEAFCNGTVKRSKLRHIDCRQEWVKTLRNKDVMRPKHVNTKENLADMFTKILDAKDFISLRNMMMYDPHA